MRVGNISDSRGVVVSIAATRSVIREQVRQAICNGLYSERGLAKLIGVSQPHLHNILKGARVGRDQALDQLALICDVRVPLAWLTRTSPQDETQTSEPAAHLTG